MLDQSILVLCQNVMLCFYIVWVFIPVCTNCATQSMHLLLTKQTQLIIIVVVYQFYCKATYTSTHAQYGLLIFGRVLCLEDTTSNQWLSVGKRFVSFVLLIIKNLILLFTCLWCYFCVLRVCKQVRCMRITRCYCSHSLMYNVI